MSNEVEQESVEINDFVESLDLALEVSRTRPSTRTERRPHTYSAWIPHLVMEDNTQVAGFGESMTDAVSALAEAISYQTVRITFNGEHHDVIAPLITTEQFGSDE